jgi:hypothetical protein
MSSLRPERELDAAVATRLAEADRVRWIAHALECLSRECNFPWEGEDLAAEISDTIGELPPSGIRDASRKRLEDWRTSAETNESLAEIYMGLDLAVMDDERPAFRRWDRSREELLGELQRDIDGLTGEGPWLDSVRQRFTETQREVAGITRRRPNDTAGRDTRHRRAPDAKPVRRRGSQRGTAPTRGDPDESDPEPPAPAPGVRRQDIGGRSSEYIAASPAARTRREGGR